MTAPFDPRALEVLLCDADGNLFPSEEPAFAASAEVTNRFLAALGISTRYSAEQLRRTTTGKSFRTTAADLAAAAGVLPEPAPAGRKGPTLTAEQLERWVSEEAQVVTAHLARVLEPDEAVRAPLRRLATRFGLAAVSSSASARLDACFAATGLDELFPPERRFSAEDSLRTPRSKPDPAIYLYAGEVLGVAGPQALAIEDSVPGVQSAAAAGFPVVGNLAFVPAAERGHRARALCAAGATALIASWRELEPLLAARARTGPGLDTRDRAWEVQTTAQELFAQEGGGG
jgi:HAD superfamily hydrolase (TIGR01509 family)